MRRLIILLAVAFAAVSTPAVLSSDFLVESILLPLVGYAVGASATAVGLWTQARRPDSAVGPLLAWSGAMWLANGVGYAGTPAMLALAAAAGALQIGLLGHVMLALPCGRARTPGVRAVAVFGYAAPIVSGGIWVLYGNLPGGGCTCRPDTWSARQRAIADLGRPACGCQLHGGPARGRLEDEEDRQHGGQQNERLHHRMGEESAHWGLRGGKGSWPSDRPRGGRLEGCAGTVAPIIGVVPRPDKLRILPEGKPSARSRAPTGPRRPRWAPRLVVPAACLGGRAALPAWTLRGPCAHRDLGGQNAAGRAGAPGGGAMRGGPNAARPVRSRD